MSSLYEEIVSQYESNGFKHTGNLEEGYKFSNKFSRHFLFILPSVQELLKKWKSLQAEVIDEYRHFKEESLSEWATRANRVFPLADPSVRIYGAAR